MKFSNLSPMTISFQNRKLFLSNSQTECTTTYEFCLVNNIKKTTKICIVSLCMAFDVNFSIMNNLFIFMYVHYRSKVFAHGS